MRADRLLSLLLLLQAKGRRTAAELARELEVSVRTIYRDLEALAAAGVPVFAESGPGGGCQLLPGYRSPLDALSVEEADALLILGTPGPLRQLGLAAPAESARQRVSRAAQRRRTPPATLVHLDMPRWFHSAEDTPHLVPLAKAVRQSRSVELVYAANNRTRPKTHTADPLGLVNKAGIWYVVARTDRGVVVFRVERIRDLAVSDDAFRRPPAFDLEAFWTDWSEDFVRSRPQIRVAVRASPRAFELLPEILGDAVRPALQAAGPPDDNGWRRVQLSFERPEVAAYRLVGLGDLVEVVEPLAVRDAIRTTASNALRLHA